MKRVLYPGAAQGPVRLTGPRFHHLARVLRVREGEALEVFDGVGTVFAARVSKLAADAAELVLEAGRPRPPPRPRSRKRPTRIRARRSASPGAE